MTRKRKWLISTTAILLGFVFALFWTRKPTIALTPQALSDAENRWNSSGIQGYDMRYHMHGSIYSVIVENGIVTSLTINDRDAQSAELSSYSVPGLFSLLKKELEVADQLNLSKDELAWKLRVHFHPRYGYPERYLRAQTMMGRAASIELIEFHPHRSEKD